MRAELLLLTSITLLVSGLGCSQKQDSSSSQSRFTVVEEPEFCEQSQIFENPATVTSKAQFLAREVTSFGLEGPSPAQDIKFAEVQVLDSHQHPVQCGMTDELGNISLNLPAAKGSYTLKVLSRSHSPYYQASVLNNPFGNLPYALEQRFTLDGVTTSLTLPAMLARHDGTVLGGAFNILDQIHKANSFLRANSTCPTQGNVCSQFTVAPPVRIYWNAGLSPYAYYGHPTSPVSFYSKFDDPAVGIRRGIYIQGGLQGDTLCTDTDHFDNSVIIHEYGHFLEDAFAKSDSPGGSHNGNFIIDPRLAWSEGWSNFFQTAVLGSSLYRDSVGNSDCTGGTYLAVNLVLEYPQTGQDRMLPGTTVGEGIFREVAVSRVLYNTMIEPAANGGAGVGFPFIWKIFSDMQDGFGNPNVHFRNVGHFNQLLRNLLSSNDASKLSPFDSSVAFEYQRSDKSDYAMPLTAQAGGVCVFHIQGSADLYSMGNYYSNLFASNDFYSYEFDGSNPILELHYSGTNPSDLDLDVYRENYSYDNMKTLVQRSRRPYPEAAGGGYEVVNLSGAPPGTYMINVKTNSSSLGGIAEYYLSTPQGGRLCP
jgi:hypothetical protein